MNENISQEVQSAFNAPRHGGVTEELKELKVGEIRLITAKSGSVYALASRIGISVQVRIVNGHQYVKRIA